MNTLDSILFFVIIQVIRAHVCVCVSMHGGVRGWVFLCMYIFSCECGGSYEICLYGILSEVSRHVLHSGVVH